MSLRNCIWMILFTQTLQGQEIFTPEWINQIHADDFDFLYPQALEVDSKGNVYIACYSHDTIWINDTPILPGTGYYSNMIAKFNTAGELLWTRNYIDTYNNSSIRVSGMKINNKDELVVYGISSGVILFDGFYLSDFTDDVPLDFCIRSIPQVSQSVFHKSTVFISGILQLGRMMRSMALQKTMGQMVNYLDKLLIQEI